MLRNAWYGRKEYDGEDNKKDIWEMISSVSYSTHIAGNAGRADQKFFEHLQEGIADNDLDKIYEFIDAYERGKSIKPDELVCRLFQKAYTGGLCTFMPAFGREK